MTLLIISKTVTVVLNAFYIEQIDKYTYSYEYGIGENVTNNILKSFAHDKCTIILCIGCYDDFPFISHIGKWYQYNVHAVIYSDRKPAQERKG